MNRMTKLLTLGVAGIIVMSMPTKVHAFCSVPQVAAHLGGGKITNCPDSFPVAGFIGVVGAAAANNSIGPNGAIDVVCEDASVPSQQGPPCQAESGTPGDGNVTIQFDWSNQPLPTGCPNPNGLPGVGRNFFQVVCNNGAGAIITVAYDLSSAGYPVDFGQPFDPAFGTFDLPATPANNGLKLASFNRSLGQDTACIDQTVSAPLVYSDCDPGSAATAFGVPCGDSTPTTPTAGANLYTQTGPKGQKPTDLRPSAWTLAATTPAGTARCVNFPTPTAGICTRVGSTVALGGSDTGAIAGWVEVCDPTAATDKVKINSASFNQGKLDVSFGTENESLIVGFNVYAGS